MNCVLSAGAVDGPMLSRRLQAAVTSASTAALCTGLSAWYFAELCTNCFVRLVSAAGLTLTVNVVDAEPLLPARSVAVADSVCDPAPNVHAGPLAFAQFEEATPDRASAAVQVMATVCSKAYVPALPA